MGKKCDGCLARTGTPAPAAPVVEPELLAALTRYRKAREAIEAVPKDRRGIRWGITPREGSALLAEVAVAREELDRLIDRLGENDARATGATKYN